jgi:hypothetical protein
MAKSNKTKQDTNLFKTAVEQTPDIATCYQAGLTGLGNHSTKINLTDTRLCQGSIDIDEGVRELYPQSNRWDYALSYENKIYFVEVHTANTTEVKTMFKKLQWLKDWLNANAPEISKLKAVKPYYWLASNGVHILKNSVQHRQLVANGFMPIAKLKL